MEQGKTGMAGNLNRVKSRGFAIRDVGIFLFSYTYGYAFTHRSPKILRDRNFPFRINTIDCVGVTR